MKIPGRRDPSELRRDMVEAQIRRRGIRDPRVLEAMLAVPRHEFVPESVRSAAYRDRALPIGHGATISQPYIVALMTAALQIDRPGLRVLEIGTGSGYQAAVLAACGCDVYSVERIPALHVRAAEVLQAQDYGDRVRLRLGDGSRGWPEEAPFDRVIITAAAGAVPPALLEQTEVDGQLIAPVGSDRAQVIRRYRRRAGEWTATDIEGALFVPLIEGPPDSTG
jgi:protein-L-isoaspartate(D-aspartate) O-methyltransferase